MSLITESDLSPFREPSTQTYNFSASGTIYENRSKSLLLSRVRSAGTERIYDVFLSHRMMDAEQLLALVRLLESLGHSVYLDWREDPQLDRTKVTPETARKLRNRMRHCKSLLFATTANSADSKWMPWELGYFDGHNGKVAIVPVVVSATTGYPVWDGQEYLGIYPYIDKTGPALYVHRTPTDFVPFSDWKNGKASLAEK